MQMSSSYVNPISFIFLGLLFGVPIAVLVIGILVYFLKPKHRKTNGKTLIAIGILELLVYLALTRNLDLIITILYTIEILTIITGIISLTHNRKKPTTSHTET
jgi:uncharacterized membrane protein HdeD (DUF308 family)